jgi:hypothetical protein
VINRRKKDVSTAVAAAPRDDHPALFLAGATPDAMHLMTVDGIVKAAPADTASRAKRLGSGDVSVPDSCGAYREEDFRVC